MANIYSAQGHRDRAREIYEAILKRDPHNDAARRGLEFVTSAG
ncbi:MAG: tetratricopeptide repeat protein [Myxococcales bacterium]|nr:tetratricopeptide repeat protein [Myxococcales bacterium]